MKNYNRRRPPWLKVLQTGATRTPTQLQLHSVKRQLSYYRIWNQIFIFKVPEGGGANQSTRSKPPTACPLNGITYSWTGIEASPSNIGDKLPWPRARALSDPLSYRPPLIANPLKMCLTCLAKCARYVMHRQL